MTQSISRSLYSGANMLALCKGMFFSLQQNILDFRSFVSFRTIDTNHDPFIPEGLEIENHVATGKIKWKKNAYAKSVRTFGLSRNTSAFSGLDLLSETKLTSVANACVLDWLIANAYQVPCNAWKGKKILFLGTTYKNRFGKSFVRCLDCTGEKICWDIICLDGALNKNSCVLLMC